MFFDIRERKKAQKKRHQKAMSLLMTDYKPGIYAFKLKNFVKALTQ